MLCFDYGQIQLILLAVQMMRDNLQHRICELEELPFSEVSETLGVLLRACVDCGDILRSLERSVNE